MTANYNSNKISVSVSFNGTDVEFKGEPESVMFSINEFVAKQIPDINIARKITLNYSLKDLVDNFSNFIKITSEGPIVWKDGRKFSDREVISLQLLISKISMLLGNSKTDHTNFSVLLSKTSINQKSLSSRLSELIKNHYVEKSNNGENTQYKITTKGIYWLENSIIKK